MSDRFDVNGVFGEGAAFSASNNILKEMNGCIVYGGGGYQQKKIGKERLILSNTAMRRIAAVFALLTCIALNAQERRDVVISVPPVTGTGSTPSDNVFFQEMTVMEIGARGYTLQKGDSPYDYVFIGELGRTFLGAEEWFFHLNVTEAATNRVIVEQSLVFKKREDIYEFFPVLIFTMLGNIPLTKTLGDAVPVEIKVPREYWLYAGLRVGSSMRVYTREIPEPFIEQKAYHWENINFAIYASYNFWSFLDVQAEIIVSNEFAPFRKSLLNYNQGVVTLRNVPFTGWSLMVPIMLKASWRREPVFASALGGIYLNAPLGNMNNDELGGSFPYTFLVPLGYTMGVSVGTKVGPGRIMLDVRWAQDFGPVIKSGNGAPLFERDMVIFAISYELPFFPKKTPAEKAAEKKQAEAQTKESNTAAAP